MQTQIVLFSEFVILSFYFSLKLTIVRESLKYRCDAYLEMEKLFCCCFCWWNLVPSISTSGTSMVFPFSPTPSRPGCGSLSALTWEAVVTCGTTVNTTVCFVSCNVVKHLQMHFPCEWVEVTVKLCAALTKMGASELYCFTSTQG